MTVEELSSQIGRELSFILLVLGVLGFVMVTMLLRILHEIKDK